jgi:hypothetical protein
MPATILMSVTAIIAVIAAIFFIVKSTVKPRNRSIRALGEQLGFSFMGNDNAILDKIKFFKLYDVTTRNASAHNVLHSKTSPPDVCIFDYEATTGPEELPATDVHTVFYFKDDRMQLPGFRLLPENSEMARRNDSVLKYRPISFATHPVFSSKFRLVGPDDHEIREFFTPEIRVFFEKQGEICVEGFASELLVYRPEKNIATTDFLKSFKLAQGVFTLFLERSKAAAGSSMSSQ